MRVFLLPLWSMALGAAACGGTTSPPVDTSDSALPTDSSTAATDTESETNSEGTESESPSATSSQTETETETPIEPVEDCTGQPDFMPCRVVTEPDRDYDICSGGTCVSPGCTDISCNAPGPHFPLTPYHGYEDFTRTGDLEPVVRDNTTGLLWQGCLAGTNGAQCEQGEIAQMKWEDALVYCNDLAWAGFDDWRLPDLKEVAALSNDRSFDPVFPLKHTP